MKTVLCCAAAVACMGMASCHKQAAENPLLSEYDNAYGVPPFEKVLPEHYAPAFEAGIAEARANVDSIVNNPEAPTFENTIYPLDYLSPTLDRTISLLGHLAEADATPEIQAVYEELSPKYSQFSDELMMNPKLFERVKVIYDNLDSLNLPLNQRRAVEKTYRQFARNGALLTPENQEKLKAVNNRLADLFITYNKNLQNANNAFGIVVENQDELEGLPQNTIDNAAAEAKKRGMEGKWVLTLDSPSRLSVLQYAKNRGLREKMWKGYTNNAMEGENNNIPVIKEILKARGEKAELLGYPSFAAYQTADVMAKTPEAAEALLMSIWGPAKAKVAQEVADMQALADANGDNITIEPWDYYYYGDRVRANRYNFDEASTAPYFSADSVRKGIFYAANKLYGVTFEEIPDAPKYNPDVKVYDVKDAEGNHLATFMTDYYARPTKRQGAWMEELTTSWVDPDGTVHRPVVYNVCNFPKPTADAPSLLSIDDVQTAFHEFGHGLHGMLSKATLKSQSGTSVDRDFVEFPSQVNEHWAFQPEVLAHYARHYKTGELIPDSLVEKINASAKHGLGFRTAELAGAALLDLKFGEIGNNEEVEPMELEAAVSEQLGMPKELTYRYRPAYFKHIFGSDGYASGYYTYLWAEQLDADAFAMFEEAGSAFDPESAARLKHVLESGDAEDPMVLYEQMRGHRPTSEALLRQRGLK